MLGIFLQKPTVMRTTEECSAIQTCFDYDPDTITQTVDAAKLLKLLKLHRASIHNVEFLPPVLGSDGFGEFKITYSNDEATEISEW